jgi:hypothetical protein
MKNRTDLRNLPFNFLRHNYQLALVFFSVMLTGYVAAQDPPPTYTELDKGLILDLSGDVGYIMNPNGTMSSIDLSNGQSRWDSSQKGKPLAFVDNQLLVQLEDSVPTNDFKIGYLNNSSGSISRTESKVLANSITAGVKSTMNYSFDTRVRVVNNRVNLSWDYEPTAFRGIAEDEGQDRSRKGVFLINKTTLNMESLGMDDFSIDVVTSKELVINAIVNAPGRQFSSIQDEYVVVIDKVSNDSQWKKYKWTIYKQDGTKVGSIRTNLSFRPFYVVDNTLVFTTVPVIRNIEGELVELPKSLVGYDLSTGNQKWTKEILDLEYRGPYPP